MLTICWAVKGGSGTTVVSCALALMTARVHDASWLIDLAGDVPATLGLAEPSGPGVHDWISSPTAAPAAIDALGMAGANGLRVVSRGTADPSISDPRWVPLAEHLAGRPEHTIVDAGTGRVPPALLSLAHQRLLVIRPCYLALRRAVAAGLEPTGIVVIHEPGRALRAQDVAAAVRAPVVAEIALDPVVARAVDAGLLSARFPRTLLSSLRDIAR